MTTPANKVEKPNTPHAENQVGIENHEQAAKHHHDATRYHQQGNHEKAYESTIKAQGHHYLAGKAQKRYIIYHALND